MRFLRHSVFTTLTEISLRGSVMNSGYALIASWAFSLMCIFRAETLTPTLHIHLTASSNAILLELSTGTTDTFTIFVLSKLKRKALPITSHGSCKQRCSIYPEQDLYLYYLSQIDHACTLLSLIQYTVSEKSDRQYFGLSFDKFRQCFIIFGTNHPDNPSDWKKYKCPINTCTKLHNDDVMLTPLKNAVIARSEAPEIIMPLLWPSNSLDLNPVD